jgi:hypothetical protein
MQNFSKQIISFLTFFIMFFLTSCSHSPDLSNRVGFGLAEKADAIFWSAQLGAEWYFDWGTKKTPKSNDLEYWQTIRVNENGYSPFSRITLDIPGLSVMNLTICTRIIPRHKNMPKSTMNFII